MPAVRHALDQLTAGHAHDAGRNRADDITLDSRSGGAGALFLACGGRSRHGLACKSGDRARCARDAVRDGAPGQSSPPKLCDRCRGLSPALSSPACEHLEPPRRHDCRPLLRPPSQTADRRRHHRTNGKTPAPVCWRKHCARCGRPAGYMGTLGFGIPPTHPDRPHHSRCGQRASPARRAAPARVPSACAWKCLRMRSIRIAWRGALPHGRIHQPDARSSRLSRHAWTATARPRRGCSQWPTLRHRMINVDDEFGARARRASRRPARLIVTSRAAAAARHCPGEFVRADARAGRNRQDSCSRSSRAGAARR